jgi:hypothetical protein
MSYPSSRSCVRMRSESTRALGQPSETNPTFGVVAEVIAGVYLGRKCGGDYSAIWEGRHLSRWKSLGDE